MLNFRRFIILLLLPVIGCMHAPRHEAEPEVPRIRALLKEVSGLDSVVFNGSYYLNSEEASYEFGSKNNRIYLKPLDDGFKLFNENRVFLFREKDLVSFVSENAEANFKLGGRTYSGNLIMVFTPEKKIMIINRVDLETYLTGVVPFEIATHKDVLLDAVKAQSICARTYAITKMKEREDIQFDVYADTRDQVYGGLGKQSELSNRGINQTKGVVLMSGEKMATVYYHSTCGGVTESAGEVWPGVNKEYLANRQDALGDHFACETSPLFRWTEARTLDQIDTLFARYFNKPFLNPIVTDTTDISFKAVISKRTPGSRVSELQISYADTTFTLKGYEIRRFFAWPPGGYLQSNLFRLASANDSTLLIEGGGSGHGVGMCQWGAMNMSENGFKYYHILSKYFPGTILKKVY